MRMSRLTFAACAVSILLLAGWLRFFDLSSAPIHFDEATGARIMSQVLEGQSYRYDPTHFHGPLLAFTGALTAKVKGEHSWHELTASGIRTTTAVCGILLVVLILAAYPLIGHVAALSAAGLVAASPVLTHFNRIFIHESLFVLVLCAAGFATAWWWRKPNLWLAAATGVLVGIAAGTRETFILAPATWVAAMLIMRIPPPLPKKHLLIAIGTAGSFALITIFLIFSEFCSRPSGFFDFISTYWQYETTPGHDKPGWYYASLYLLPFSHGRIHWWFGGAFVIAATTFLLPHSDRSVKIGRVLLISALLQAAVFSFISYKVPWLMLMPWTQVLIAAGLAVAAACSRLRSPALLVLLIALAVVGFDAVQAWRVQSPARARNSNPLQYVATVPRIEIWTERTIDWLRAADAAHQTVAVIGQNYWPLPWYLRTLPNVGYWSASPPGISTMPLIIAMPTIGESIAEKLHSSHTFMFEGLRTDTPVFVFLRNDIWELVIAQSLP
jgi:uncharacterized protein (TIGR03663 family)